MGQSLSHHLPASTSFHILTDLHVVHLTSPSEKLVPYDDRPLPFFLEYAEGTDMFDTLKPWLKVLVALNQQLGVLGHQGFTKALASTMEYAVGELWPHHKQVFAIMNSQRSGRKIISVVTRTYVQPLTYYILILLDPLAPWTSMSARRTRRFTSSRPSHTLSSGSPGEGT